MKKITVILLALLISFTLCACRKSALCGKWYSLQNENTVIFDEKGNFELQFWDGDLIKGTYVIKNQEGNLYTLTLRDSKGREQDTLITINGKEMTMPNGLYQKQ